MNSRVITIGLFIVTWLFPMQLSMAISSMGIHSSGKKWKQELVLRDYLRFIDYGEQLIHYQVSFPGTFTADKVVVRLGDERISHQLSDVVENEGKIVQASVWFRTSLKKGEKKIFTVEQSQAVKSNNGNSIKIIPHSQEEQLAIIRTNNLKVKVPHGSWKAEKSLKDVPAPFIAFSYDNPEWIGNGSFQGNASIDSISTKIINSGPLFLKYRINYYLPENTKYTVDLTAYQFEKYITIDEYLQGFNPEDELNFIYSFQKGINPSGRLALEKAGYETGLNGVLHSGAYNDVNFLGKMPQILRPANQEGDQLHLVAPTSVRIQEERKPYGVLVNKHEYICTSDKKQEYKDESFEFTGKSGYARKNQLAIFEGESIKLDDFQLAVSGGNFGASARLVDNHRLEGRIAGKEGGTLKVTVPDSFEMEDKEVQILKMHSTKRIIPEIAGNTFVFNADVSLEEDGYYVNYQIVPANSPLGKQPVHPVPYQEK